MLGSEFVATYAKRGINAWEAAVVDLALQGALCPWPLFELPLADDAGNTAVLTIRSDALAVGSIEDHVRMPLLPSTAQSCLNYAGALLPTPWLSYQMYRAAPVKLQPVSMVPNKGADLLQYAAHSAAVDQLKGDARLPASGVGKHIVVSNGYFGADGRPRSIQGSPVLLIQGWYRPPPSPDVYDDRRPLDVPDRQPVQPLSWAHASFYVDYSHVVTSVEGICVVNGRPTLTEDLYKHPTLSRLVSNEGPLKMTRYPSKVPVRQLDVGASAGRLALDLVRQTPSALDQGLAFASRSGK